MLQLLFSSVLTGRRAELRDGRPAMFGWKPRWFQWCSSYDDFYTLFLLFIFTLWKVFLFFGGGGCNVNLVDLKWRKTLDISLRGIFSNIHLFIPKSLSLAFLLLLMLQIYCPILFLFNYLKDRTKELNKPQERFFTLYMLNMRQEQWDQKRVTVT